MGIMYIYTSEDWSLGEVMEEKNNYYCLSKTYAEKRAWELSKEEGCPYKFCVLCPSLIWGPMVRISYALGIILYCVVLWHK